MHNKIVHDIIDEVWKDGESSSAWKARIERKRETGEKKYEKN